MMLTPSCKVVSGQNTELRDIQVKPAKKSPAAPFTTSTLQQEASRKMGYSVSRTMLLAQKLYESGYISYMRTDSVNLSDTALDGYYATGSNRNTGTTMCRCASIKTKMNLHRKRTKPSVQRQWTELTVDDADCRKLYELIWKRTMASQMADAELEKTIAKINISTNKEDLTAQGEVSKIRRLFKSIPRRQGRRGYGRRELQKVCYRRWK